MSRQNQLTVLFPQGTEESEIDRLLQEAVHSVNQGWRSWTPACNAFEDEQGFTVQMALPGVDAKQIDVQVEHQVLRVKGERKHEDSEGRQWYMQGIGAGSFACTFNLPDYADREKSTASYTQGLLTIIFPKREEAKPRSIMIECQ
jgi:HSP20 family protein